MIEKKGKVGYTVNVLAAELPEMTIGKGFAKR